MRRVVFCDWDSVPHLTEAMKQAQLSTMDPHLRDARTRGIPFLGSGAVYPVLTEFIEENPFDIPDHWPRAYGLDVGWNKTAALWGALDPSSDILHIYDEHYVGEENPNTHANAIMGYGVKGSKRASWIPGFIDPGSKGKSQADGTKLIDTYRQLGLKNLKPAATRLTESAVHDVWIRLSSGRLKVFKTLQFFFKEYLLYRRDANGKIIENKARPDHLMDALKFIVTTAIPEMKPVPPAADDVDMSNGDPEMMSECGWMSV